MLWLWILCRSHTSTINPFLVNILTYNNIAEVPRVIKYEARTGLPVFLISGEASPKYIGKRDLLHACDPWISHCYSFRGGISMGRGEKMHEWGGGSKAMGNRGQREKH